MGIHAYRYSVQFPVQLLIIFFSDVCNTTSNSLNEKLLKKERKNLLTIHKEFIFLLCLFLSNSILILQRELETVAKNADGNKVWGFFLIKNKFSCKEKKYIYPKTGEKKPPPNLSEFRNELN